MNFTPDERKLILSASAETPFRVLQVDNVADSAMLRSKSENLSLDNDPAILHQLIARMQATMQSESGVGIAAVQIGILRNVFLFTRFDRADRMVEVAINPKIRRHSKDLICFERDGCLSVPNRSENTLRYKWIEVEFTNLNGQKIREKLSGYSRNSDFTGIIFQHEFDHLQGTLYTDRKIESQNP